MRVRNAVILSYIKILVVNALLCSTALWAQSGGEQERTDKFKAIFIYNFTQYIEWPEEDSTGTFAIDILGSSNLQAPLEEIARKRSVRGQKLVVNQRRDLKDIGNSQILFIATEHHHQLEDIGRQLKNKAVLTIGDTEGLAHRGAGVNFTLVDGKLKFEMNRKAIERAGLTVSSHLLKLAILVGETP